MKLSIKVSFSIVAGDMCKFLSYIFFLINLIICEAFEPLVPLSLAYLYTYTCGLSTLWSTTALL